MNIFDVSWIFCAWECLKMTWKYLQSNNKLNLVLKTWKLVVFKAIIESGDTTSERKSLRETFVVGSGGEHEQNSSFISSIVVEVIRVTNSFEVEFFIYFSVHFLISRHRDCVSYIFHSVCTKVFGGFYKLSSLSRVEEKCRNITGADRKRKT